jgi:hypothetical protein
MRKKKDSRGHGILTYLRKGVSNRMFTQTTKIVIINAVKNINIFKAYSFILNARRMPVGKSQYLDVCEN